MEIRHCTVCRREVDKDTAPILVMGGFANPRLLCEDCSVSVELITSSVDPEKIEEAMGRISKKLSENGVDDELTVETITEMFTDAGERVKKIRSGEYVPENEAEAENVLDDIPDELLETEEDRLLDERDEEQGRLFDKIFTWVAIVAFAVVIGYFILTRFIL